MVQNLGRCLPYSTGTTGRPLPLHDPTAPLHTHQQAPRKPTGLDWDALKPHCALCGQGSSQLDKTDVCPACRGVLPTTGDPASTPESTRADDTYTRYTPDDVARRYTPDNTELGRDLERAAAENPKVAAASDRLDDTITRITRPEDHIQAPTDPDCDIPTTDFQGDVTPDTPDPSPAPAAATAVEPLAPPAHSPTDEGDVHEQASAGEAPTPATSDTSGTTNLVENRATDAEQAFLGAFLTDRMAEAAFRRLLGFDDPDQQVAEHAATAADILTTPIPDRPQHHVPDPTQRVEQALHATNIDAGVRHTAQVLTDTAQATDPVTRMLRLNVQQAIEALYLYTQLHPEHPTTGLGVDPQTPVVAAPPLEQADRQPATTGTPVAPRTRKQKTGRRATTTRPSQRGRSGGRNGTTGKLTGHDQRIIDRYQAGEPCTSIAADYDCTPTAIRHLLRRNNIQLRTAGESNRGRTRPTARVLTPDEEQDIARAYAAGDVSMATLATRYGSSETAIRRCLKEQGIPSRRIGTRVTPSSTYTTATSTGETA